MVASVAVEIRHMETNATQIEKAINRMQQMVLRQVIF